MVKKDQDEAPGGSLDDHEVHVWGFSLNVSESIRAGMLELLSRDEKERASRFRFDRHRNRFIAGRGTLRQLIASYTNLAPAKLRFEYGAHGKPSLATKGSAAKIFFNLAHSEDVALLAIGKQPELGVDVEQVRWLEDFDELVNRFFSPSEAAEFIKLSPENKPESFFNLWTRKEAWLKAIGEGIGYSLNRVEVSFDPTAPARLLKLPDEQQGAGEWSLRALNPASGYVGALAVKAKNPQVDFRLWQPNEESEGIRTELENSATTH